MDKLMWSLRDVAKVEILNARIKLTEGALVASGDLWLQALNWQTVHLQLVVIFGCKIDVNLLSSADAEK